MEILLTILIVGAVVRWIIVSRRLRDIESRLENVTLLYGRMAAAERRLDELRGPPPAMAQPAAMPEPEPIREPEPEGEPEPVVAPPPLPAVVFEEAEDEALAPFEPALPLPVPSPRVRPRFESAEWEAVVGGSWLNKVGMLVLVIGIALFLGYSFTQFGPGGRSAMALAVSAALLAGGVAFERRATFRGFGRGLIGGGWAALYFTVYAMQAVEAAKVIHNPLLGGLLLLGVAAGMIAHSLRYRSETVTGLAYFAAFATLAITPVTAFSVIALIPLAASLLYIANRFSWSAMAALGLIATYGACASRGDTGASLSQTQLLFSIYWLLFETYDLLRARRGGEYNAWERSIFAMNAIAFTSLSFAKWSAAATGSRYALAAALAVVYLGSAVLRMRLRPPSSFDLQSNTFDRAFSGGYEGPVTLTAAFAAAAMLLKLNPAAALFGLLFEAEAFFLCGLVFRAPYPRELGAALFGFAFAKVAVVDGMGTRTVSAASFQLYSWTPAAACAAGLFYLNRALRKVDLAYGYAGTAAVALVTGFEIGQRYLGLTWFAIAAVLFAFGWARRLRDFRVQGYAMGILGVAAVSIYELNAAPVHPWLVLGVAAALTYAAIVTALRSPEDRMESWERAGITRVGSWAVTGLLLALCWRVLPEPYIGVGALGLALALLELGLRGWPVNFRIQSYVAAGWGAALVFFGDLAPVHNDGPWGPRLAIAFAALLGYALAARMVAAQRRGATHSELGRTADLTSAGATFFLLAALWALLPAVAVAPAWAAAALLLLEAGYALDLPALRFESQAVAAAAFGRLFFLNFIGMGRTNLGQTNGVSHRLLTVAPVALSFYYHWWRVRAAGAVARAGERRFARWFLYAAAISGVALLRFELGRTLAVTGWALYALCLLLAGRRWNVGDLRWQAYALAALTFARSWTTNFAAPESFTGAAGRVLTGAFVIACLYAMQLSIPLSETRRPDLERYARLFCAALGTVLLTVLLFHEVSGGVLTMAWGLEAVALLSAGFPLRDRIPRLMGLALFLICILKLFLYDLRQLETLYRILSFIVLGVILVGVSWIYTRFRDRIERYL